MNIFDKAINSITSAWNGIFDNFDKILYGILQIVLIIIGAWVIKKLIRILIKKAVLRKARKNPDSLASKKAETLSSLLINVSKYVILFLEVTAILSVLGLGTTVTSLLTTAGIGGLAIGLGAQSLINDATNGLFLLVDDEFAVGDYVQLDNFKGTVISMTVRTTRLRLPNNEIVTIPNGRISTVINYTRDNYQLFVDTLISLDEDTNKVGMEILTVAAEYANANSFVTAEPAFIGAVEITPSYQKLRIAMMVTPLQQWQAERELKAEILKMVKEKGIKTPPIKESVFIRQ